MKLTLKSVQTQAQENNYIVERISTGYEVTGNNQSERFRLLAEAVQWLNKQQCSVTPELSLRDVQQLACEMGFTVLRNGKNYEIYYQTTGQLLGKSDRLDQVVRALPQYKSAIIRYYEEEAKIACDGTQSSDEFDTNVSDVNVSTAAELEVSTQQISSIVTAEFRSEIREVRAEAIEVIEQHGDKYVVQNRTNNNHYVVNPSHPEPNQRCECGDCHFRGVRCKHQIAVQAFNKEVQFIPDNGGYDFKALFEGEVVALVQEDIWANAPGWEVLMGGEIFKVSSKEKAFKMVRDRISQRVSVPTVKRVARQLEKGDGILFNGVIYEVVGLRSQVISAVRRNIYSIQFELELKSVEGNLKSLNPYSEFEFQVIEF